MSTVDLTPLVNVLLPIALATVPTVAAILVPYTLKRLGIANDADLKNNLELALNAAAGGAYKYAASHEGGLSNIAVNNGALADATTYVVSNMPDTLAKLGITPAKVTDMVSKRLGALLATDPTVTAGKPPAAVATGAPAATVTRTTSTSQTVAPVAPSVTGTITP